MLQDIRLGSHTTLQKANPGSILTLPSQTTVEDSEVFRESDGYCFMLRLRRFVGLFHTSCVSSKCTCLTGNFQETQEVIQDTRPGWWPKEFCCMSTLELTVLLQSWISLFPGVGKFFHIRHDCLIYCTLACKRTAGNSEDLLHSRVQYIKQTFYSIIVLHDDGQLRSETSRNQWFYNTSIIAHITQLCAFVRLNYSNRIVMQRM